MLVEIFLKYKFIFLFYLLIILFLYLKRKKVDVQAKVIFLYRMQWGIKWMDKYSKKFREWVILLGYTGVGVGFVGLVFISYYLVRTLIEYFTVEEIVSSASLVYPGMTVPGLGILPFWDWIIAIFIIAVVHEFSHGIVAMAHKLKVKNTGIVLLGPILGAFVEPDENQLRKKEDIVQYSVLAAGSFSNIVLAVLALLLLTLIAPALSGMATGDGFTFDSYVSEDLPFAKAGILPGTIVNGINGQGITKFEEFSEELRVYRPGEKITINTEIEDYTITLAQNPDFPKRGFLGIKEIKNEYEIKEKYQSSFWTFIHSFITWFTGFLRWLFLLSLGIGIFNLLPLPIVDGGRMAQVFLQRLKGKEKGDRYYAKVSIFFLIVLLLNLVYPFLSGLF